MLLTLLVSSAVLPRRGWAASGDPLLISELFASHRGTDNAEFLELYGIPGLSLNGLSLVVVEGDAGPAGPGTIDRRLDFGPADRLGSNGFYLVGNPLGLVASYHVEPNRAIRPNFFENSSLTVALVRTPSLSGGVGSFVTSREIILDAVALTDGDAGDQFFFSAPVIGPDGVFFPAGARRQHAGVDTDSAADWVIADFDLGPANTPTPGDAPPPPPPPVIPIGQVQGQADGAADTSSYASPLVGQPVSVQGVIYQKTLELSASGGSLHGFFIQNTAAASDGDPASSDGIFVFLGSQASLGSYIPAVGDELVIQGIVTESLDLTQLTGIRLVSFERRGVDLDAELPAFVADPPADRTDASLYWERHEGMRAQVPAGSLVIARRAVLTATLDAEIWLARSDSAFNQRAASPRWRFSNGLHPLDSDLPRFALVPGYCIILGSLGLKAAANDSAVLVSTAQVYAVLTNAPIGGVYDLSGKYQLMVDHQPLFIPGLNPSWHEPP